MFEFFRQKCMETLLWNSQNSDLPQHSEILTLECWRRGDLTLAVKDQNYRATVIKLDKASVSRADRPADERLWRWLKSDKPDALQQHPPAKDATIGGGIRLVFCDKLSIRAGLAITRANFEAIETSFNLHTATLPAISTIAGTYGFFYETNLENDDIKNISIVLKVPQRSDITNYALSLFHDLSTGWTNALICGDGMMVDRREQAILPNLYDQLTSLVLANPASWSNPLFLPFILLQDYESRMEIRAGLIIDQVIQLEQRIGVTDVGAIKGGSNRFELPQNLDAKNLSISLHSLSTRLQNLGLSFQWHQDCASALIKTSQELLHQDCLKYHRPTLRGVRQNAEFLRATTQRRQARVAAFEHRAQLQNNVLLNLISQQDSFVNRQDALLNFRIARSTKQDSVSVATFTFITALFVPGTFVATLFSMTMFDWRNNSETNTGGSSDLQQGGMTISYVTDKFWIFWAVTIPLTFITMSGWYLWSKLSSKNWLEELGAASAQDQEAPRLLIPSNAESSEHVYVERVDRTLP